MEAIWAIGNNPRRRRRKGGKRARRKMSAKQRQYFGGGKKRRSRRRSASGRKRRRSRRSAAASYTPRRRSRRRSGGGGRMRFSTGSAVSLLKSGAIGGAGAVLVDVAMGQVSKLLASAMPSLATPANTDGTPNYGYYGVKAAVAIGIGTYGARFTGYAPQMAEGALSVLAYQFLRPMVPASIPLGYVNPAPTMRRVAGQAPGSVMAGTGRYLPLSAYSQVPVRGSGAGAGARAANVLNLRGR